MSEMNRDQTHQDPSGNTEAFRAFVQRDEPPPPPAVKSALPLILIAVAAVAVLAVVLFLIFR